VYLDSDGTKDLQARTGGRVLNEQSVRPDTVRTHRYVPVEPQSDPIPRKMQLIPGADQREPSSLWGDVSFPTY